MLKGIPEVLTDGIGELKYSSVETRYFEENLDTSAHLIYYPDPDLPFHRILVRSNFCTGSKGYWTETNAERTELFRGEDRDRFHYLNEYAYPLNTKTKPRMISELLSWSEQRGVIGVGRWGEWEHYNSDVTVAKAMSAVAKIMK